MQEAMYYRPFGRSGIAVSRYCLGAMMFGSMGNPNREECPGVYIKSVEEAGEASSCVTSSLNSRTGRGMWRARG